MIRSLIFNAIIAAIVFGCFMVSMRHAVRVHEEHQWTEVTKLLPR